VSRIARHFGVSTQLVHFRAKVTKQYGRLKKRKGKKRPSRKGR
jgi:hypothetical protein